MMRTIRAELPLVASAITAVVFIFFGAVILLVIVVAGIITVDRRLDSFEERLSYRSPVVNEPASSGEPVVIEGEGHAIQYGDAGAPEETVYCIRLEMEGGQVLSSGTVPVPISDSGSG